MELNLIDLYYRININIILYILYFKKLKIFSIINSLKY